MKIIDTHSHLNFNAYKKDLDEVIKRTLDSGVFCINVGSKYETSKEAVELAEKYNGMYAAIGLHPIFAGAEFVKIKTDPEEGEFLVKEQDFDEARYRDLVLRSRSDEGKNKVVAIGEIGLDYYYKPKTKNKLEQFKEKQKQIFLQQLDLARDLDLPVIIHCRMAHDDLIKILGAQVAVSWKNIKGVIHCFTGGIKELEQYLNLGFYIGLNGIIFKLDLDEVIRKCPLESILVETDCPYLTPPQEGKEKRNEPIFVKHVIQKIADLKGISFDQVASATAQNAKKLFKF
jgi:TatD DNase family protein